jgi:hypothetical protein
MPAYPNVPDAPGVPPLSRDPASTASDQPVTVVVTKSAVNALATGRWGIFDQTGKVAVLATGETGAAAIDSCVSIAYDGEEDTADYPVEGGGFETYNKVEHPYVIGARLVRGGGDDAIATFKKAVIQLKGALDPLTVLTPQYAHLNVNVVKVSFRRSAENGVAMLTADLTLKEMRIGEPTEFSSTTTPAGADPTDSGNAQARAPTTTEQSAITTYQANPAYPGVK